MDIIRWHQRFDSFLATLASIEGTVMLMASRELSDLEKAGAVQQFEVCWEAGWKTMRDYLFFAGNPVDIPVPVNVIRASFEANLITDGDAWINAMKARNKMSHEYDFGAFTLTVGKIGTEYLPLLQSLRSKLQAERYAGN
jgi:nucleotidyltransferase substrate binding protein (TIGR01987 family)